MKNTRKTVPFLLLSTMALGLIVAVTTDRAPEADPLLEDEIVTTEDGGRAIAFGNHVKKANEVDTAHPVLGIDVTDVGENKAIRFVAAIDGYQGLSKATWTRSVKEADAVIKEEASFDLKYVYTELPRAADVQWTTPLEEGKTYYYMTYTLNNLPEANWWSEIDVSLKTYDLAGGLVDSLDDRANVWGVLGDPTVGSVTYTKYEDEGDTYYGDYYFYGGGTGDIVVAPFVWSLVPEEDHLAESLGKVVTAGDLGSTSGCFENKKGLGNVTLPDTIVEFNRWAFAGTEVLGTVNFPASLETIGSSCFGHSTSINRILFEASNLTSIQSGIQTAVNEFVVPYTVTALPQMALFTSDGLIGRITYEGTEAEWAALTAAAPGNHIVSDWTFCSDTEVATVTFDLNGGTGTAPESQSVAYGDTAAEPANPSRSGYVFSGWSTSQTGGDVFDFTTPVTGALTLYAQWTSESSGVTYTYYNNFDANDTSVYETDTPTPGDRVTPPADPERSGGWHFDGWYDNKECEGEAINFRREYPTVSKQLYAKWTPRYTFEAEYTNLNGKLAQGSSDNGSGPEVLIQSPLDVLGNGDEMGMSNGYYVGKLYYTGAFLEFNINASEADDDATIILRLTPDLYDMTFTPDSYQVLVNGTSLDYGEIVLDGAYKAGEKDPVTGADRNPDMNKRPFQNYVLDVDVELVAGVNTIRLVTTNSRDHGGTFNAETPLVDCIYVASDATLTWIDARTDNVGQTDADINYRT